MRLPTIARATYTVAAELPSTPGQLALRLTQICNFDPVTGNSAKLERLKADLEEKNDRINRLTQRLVNVEGL